MIKTTEKELTSQMFNALESEFQHLTQHQMRKISVGMAKIANTIMTEATDETMKSLSKVILDLEQHKKKYRDTIDTIQKDTKFMLDKLKKEGLVTLKNNPKTNKVELVGRSSVITDMVKFINSMNDTIMDFYENVYEISSKEAQTNLFS